MTITAEKTGITPSPVGDWKRLLSPGHLEQVFTVLEAAHHAPGGEAFKETMVESLASTFDVDSTTFFFGREYQAMFSDPAPPVVGIPDRLMRNYHEHWYDKDIFTMPAAEHALTRHGFATLRDLSSLPEEQVEYVHGQLIPHGLGSAAALHLTFADGEAILGLFDAERPWTRPDIVAMQLLARHLSPVCATMELGEKTTPDLWAVVSPRQREVAELISEGYTNAAIAERLCVTEMTVKKYVSRIFEATGLHNRAMLAAAVLRGG